jgi:hypothetical protein
VYAFIDTRSTTPVKSLLFADRQLNRHDRAVERQPHRLQRAFERRAFAIQPVDDDQPRQLLFFGGGPRLFGLHFDAGHGIDHDQRRVGDLDGGARVGKEIAEARRVDQVDFGLVPLRVGEARGQRVLAGDFFFVVIVTVLPSSTLPSRFTMPASNNKADTNCVLPDPP